MHNFCSQQFRRALSVEVPPIELEYKKEIDDIYQKYADKKDRKQALVGIVVSVKCSKSITVKVPVKRHNAKYDKYYDIHRRFMAHDEKGKALLGDVVRIVPSRPYSRMKRHVLMDIVKRPPSADTWQEQIAIGIRRSR